MNFVQRYFYFFYKGNPDNIYVTTKKSLAYCLSIFFSLISTQNNSHLHTLNVWRKMNEKMYSRCIIHFNYSGCYHSWSIEQTTAWANISYEYIFIINSMQGRSSGYRARRKRKSPDLEISTFGATRPTCPLPHIATPLIQGIDIHSIAWKIDHLDIM
jgi:hypothetical protein